MIDLHSHILHSVDDGARSLEESLEMIKIALNDGITGIVATPHDLNGVYENPRTKILADLDVFKKEVDEAGLHVKIYPGADVQLAEKLIEGVKGLEVMTVNDGRKYVFVELPSQVIPMHINRLVFDMKCNGLTPIFTHPERNFFIQKDPNIMYDFIEKGALSQLTASSLTGGFGNEAKECAKRLLKCRMAHIIATDAHSAKRRPPVLREGVKAASKVIGADDAEAMVREIPGKIVAGKQVYAEEPKRFKSTFSFFKI